MRYFTLVLLVGSLCFLNFVSPAIAQTETPEPTYTQDEIFRLMDEITETYGIGFVIREEWYGSSGGDIINFVDFLQNMLVAFEIMSDVLYESGNPPDDSTPQDYFRLIFDRANIEIDRTAAIQGGFYGNTLPQIENSLVVGYMVQFTPVGFNSQFIIIHEFAHIIDGILDDAPQNAFIDELGGEWTEVAWIPGEDYNGNEEMFPRAVAGPNEDFADTFANMILGRLTEELTPARLEFMTDYIPQWLELLETLPEDYEDLP